MGAVLAVAACGLPRGAPQKSEVINDEARAKADFIVEKVDRANVARLKDWPVTGWHGHFHWPNAGHGPESNLIRPGDRIALTIWDSQPNSLLIDTGRRSVRMENLEVSPNGTVFVPYADEVRISGMTPHDARAAIQDRLQPIASSAQVQIELNPGQGNAVDLVEGVATPGTYPLANRNTTLLSMIARGGGIAPHVENPLVRLIRGRSEYEIRAGDLMANSSRNVLVKGGDKIVVDEDERFFIAFGATREERLMPFPKESLTALEAVSLLGGVLDHRANPKGLLVLREYEAGMLGDGVTGPSKERVVFSLDLASADGLFSARKFPINPGDVVIATESAVKPAQSLVALIGSGFAIFSRFD